MQTLTTAERLDYALAQLTPPQQDYALEFGIHGNSAEASKAAGITYSTGLRWAGNPWIVGYVGILKALRQDAALVNYSQIEHRFNNVAMSDMRDYWVVELIGHSVGLEGEDVPRYLTRLKRPNELSYRQAQCIQQICYDKQAIKLYNQQEANRDIAKLNGYFEKQIDDELAVPVTSISFSVREPVAVPALESD